ncbi:MAG: hypothetical protein ACYTF1_19240 [Planctomycetota bacterium]|jgi:hypothetical protein
MPPEIHAFYAGQWPGGRVVLPVVRFKLMRLWLILVTLTALFVSLAGCGAGMADSRSDRWHRIKLIIERDNRQMVDDWDHIMLNDRTSRFSYYATE